MSKRSVLIVLSILLAVCVAVPASGQSPSKLIRKAVALAKKSDKRSK